MARADVRQIVPAWRWFKASQLSTYLGGDAGSVELLRAVLAFDEGIEAGRFRRFDETRRKSADWEKIA